MEESGPFPSTTKNTQYPWEERRRGRQIVTVHSPVIHALVIRQRCGCSQVESERRSQRKKKTAYYAGLKNMEIDHMESGVIIMAAFTRLFFMVTSHLSFFSFFFFFFYLNESNMKSTETAMGTGDEY